MKTSKTLLLAGIVSVVVAGGAALALASPERHGVMADHHSFFCDMKGSFDSRVIGQIERTVKPTDTQKAEFETLKTALTKASDTLKSSCPKEGEAQDLSPPGRLAAMERHLSAMLDAVKLVRPAATAFYAKLDDKQRDALRWAMPMDMDGSSSHHDGLMMPHHKGPMMPHQNDEDGAEQ